MGNKYIPTTANRAKLNKAAPRDRTEYNREWLRRKRGQPPVRLEGVTLPNIPSVYEPGRVIWHHTGKITTRRKITI